jgi:stress-induced morphogen
MGNISTSASTHSKSNSPLPSSVRRSPHPKPIIRRGYSTSESSIAGTIGKGEQGIADEIQRGKEMLMAPEHLNEKEREIWEMLMRELKAEKLEVQDISGGCGSMYGIEVVSERFRGLSMLKQQRLVNEVLAEEIKGWHGVQLKTRAP